MATMSAVGLVIAANEDTWENTPELLKNTKRYLNLATDTQTDVIVCPSTHESADAALIRRFASFLNYDNSVVCSAPANQKAANPDALKAYDCAYPPGPTNCLQQAEMFRTVYAVSHDLHLLASLERLEKAENRFGKMCIYVFSARQAPAKKRKARFAWRGPTKVYIIGPHTGAYATLLAKKGVEVTVPSDGFSFGTPPPPPQPHAQGPKVADDAASDGLAKAGSAPAAQGVLILFDGDVAGQVDTRTAAPVAPTAAPVAPTNSKPARQFLTKAEQVQKVLNDNAATIVARIRPGRLSKKDARKSKAAGGAAESSFADLCVM